VCIGESAAGAHDLLRGAPNSEEQTATGEAEHFLREELANGPRPAGEVEAGARKIGIAKTTLFRARKTLGIKPHKEAFQGPWMWALHEDSNPPDRGMESSWLGSSEKPAPHAGLRAVEHSEGSTPYMTESSGLEGAFSEGCVCRSPARSPRANGPDFCQTCKRPVGGAA
jgi:hypothetical protein